MKSLISKVLATSALAIAFLGVSTQTAFAESTGCEINGRSVPCDQLYHEVRGFAGIGIALALVCFAFAAWSIIFWVVMMIHLITHKVENQLMWIVLMFLFSLPAAIIYYFAVKRSYRDTPPPGQIPTGPTPNV